MKPTRLHNTRTPTVPYSPVRELQSRTTGGLFCSDGLTQHHVAFPPPAFRFAPLIIMSETRSWMIPAALATFSARNYCCVSYRYRPLWNAYPRGRAFKGNSLSLLGLGDLYSRRPHESIAWQPSPSLWMVSRQVRKVPRDFRSWSRPWELRRRSISTSHTFQSHLGVSNNSRDISSNNRDIGYDSRDIHDLRDGLLPWPEALAPGTNLTATEAVNQVANWLQMHEVVDPEPSASELLAKAAGFRSPQHMFAERPPHMVSTSGLGMTAAKWVELKRLCGLRAAKHVPVQYLVGEWDFHHLSLEMKPPTLIPRPETEELVEIVLKWVHRELLPVESVNHDASTVGGGNGLRFLDVGSGTGAIGLALLNELPNASCVAIDVEESAVALSLRNAKRTGLQERYSCFHASITHLGTSNASNVRVGCNSLEDIDPKAMAEVEFDGAFDFIVSNPPYIPKQDMASLPLDVAAHEDSVALDGGEDGLDVIREIVRRCPRLLKKGGARQLWMEVDASHPEVIRRWLGLKVEQEGQTLGLGVTKFEWMSDMSQRPRFVRLTFTEEGHVRGDTV